MSIFAKVKQLAASPQGKRAFRQAGAYARSPEGKRRISEVGKRLTSSRKRPH